MQLALRADSPGPSTRLHTKVLVAGVAMASAGVIAVNPVAPALPEIQERALALSAFANPVTPWTDAVANAFHNLGTLTTNGSNAFGALAQSLANPELYAEVANLLQANLTNPQPLLTELFNIPANHGAGIGAGVQASVTALQQAFANLPTVLQNTVNYLGTGQFVEAFSELNIWFLVQLLERPGRPLFPLLNIPGDIAANIPGAERLPAVLDALFARGTAMGVAKALLGPPITAILQVAEIFDAVRASVMEQDFGTALSHLISIPAKVLNAFVNGYVPNFPTRSQFPGLLSDGGPLDYFFVDLPQSIATALSATPVAPQTANAAAFGGSPADVTVGGGDTVTLEVEKASDSEAARVSEPEAEDVAAEVAPVVEEAGDDEAAEVTELTDTLAGEDVTGEETNVDEGAANADDGGEGDGQNSTGGETASGGEESGKGGDTTGTGAGDTAGTGAGDTSGGGDTAGNE